MIVGIPAEVTLILLAVAVALQSYAADPKFKKYVQQVEKCLNSFDNVHEWADCISFLKQLLKVRKRIFSPSTSYLFLVRHFSHIRSSKKYLEN